MKKIAIFIPVVFLIVHTFSGVAFPWKVNNHEQISEIAVNISSLQLYLENNLGLDFLSKQLLGPTHNKYNPFSIQEFSNDEYYTATKWIIHGSGAEDEYFEWYHFPVYGKNMRSINHFYNPFWDNNDIYPYPNDGWGNDWNFQQGGLYDNLATGISDVDLWVGKPLSRWAYDGSPETPPNSYFTRSNTNYFSWVMARKYFYASISGNSTGIDGIDGIKGKVNMNEQERDRCFALLFRSLGQLIHLVQDAGVPEHTRNDAHPLSGVRFAGFWPGFEYHAAKQNFNNPSWASVIPWQSIVKSDNPILDFFDANRSGEGYSSIDSTGLAEFSNYQFFTKDSIADNLMHDYCEPDCEPQGHERHRFFTHPRIDENLMTIETGNIYNTYYYWSGEVIDPIGVDGSQFFRLAKRRWYHNILVLYGWNDYTTEDTKIWDDYLDILVPKSIGYSAALLDYFFRGKIEISAPEGFLYSIIDGSISPQQFDYINVNLRNNTPKEKNEKGEITTYEEMGSGTLVAIAKYKKRTNYAEDLSNDPPTASSREDNFSYSVSKSIGVPSLSHDEPEEFMFDFSDNPIPAGITDLYLQVVFEGTLGNEENIAVAVGMKDLNEPMHICSWNSTDRVYLYGQLYTADYIRSHQALLDLIPYGFNIDPYNNLETGAAYYLDTVPTYYHSYNNPLPTARYGRIIVLTDAFSFNIFVAYASDDPYADGWFEAPLAGVINQDDSEGNFQTTQPVTFRGIKSHQHYGLFIWYPDGTGIMDAPWPSPSNADPIETEIYP